LFFSNYFSAKNQLLWLLLSLAIALFYGLQSLIYAFSNPYLIQDDARQHVVWFEKFIHPELFNNDLIADYFTSMAPLGYKAFYHFFAILGIEPLVLAKIIPLILGLVTTYYCFATVIQIFPLPLTGFIASLVLNQNLWIEDDLASATPRAFLYPLFVAFLYYLLKKNKLMVCLMMALQALFYPSMAILSLVILTLYLWSWNNWKTLPTIHQDDFSLWLLPSLITCSILLPYALQESVFGPLITVEKAKLLPEFNQIGKNFGRSFFFSSNPAIYWLFGSRSGLFSIGICSPLCLASVFLPFYLHKKENSGLINIITPKIKVIKDIFVAGVLMFVLAHLFLFQLHLPSRYIYHPFRIALPIASSIVLTVWVQKIFSQKLKQIPVKTWWQISLCSLMIIVPFFPFFSLENQLYIQGKYPLIYQYLQNQPPNTLVASLSKEANNIPTFSKCKTLVAPEYALPYHLGYYREISQRTTALIEAQYTPDVRILKQFIQQYGVNFILLSNDAYELKWFKPTNWVSSFETAINEARENILQGKQPALSNLISRCQVVEDKSKILLDTKCIITTGKLDIPS
jgi:hypothetical protein